MAKKTGLNPAIYSGLNKKRMQKGTGSNRTIFEKGKSVTGQLLDAPGDMREFDQHVFRDGGKWCYVPCAGSDCPLCEDDDRDVSKTSYKFIANFYNHKTKKVEVIGGPKDLAGRISMRWEAIYKKQFSKLKSKKKAAKKANELFLAKVWDITQLDRDIVAYDVESSDEDAVRLDPKKHKRHDLDQYVADEMKRYFGDDMPKGGSKSALDDDDDDAEDDEYDRDDLEEMSPKEVKRVAKSLGIKTVNPKNDEPRSTSTLIKLILKSQD